MTKKPANSGKPWTPAQDAACMERLHAAQAPYEARGALGPVGRLDFTGAEVRPFDEDGARATARWFRDRGVTTLGVCFLHAYANPANEQRAAEIQEEGELEQLAEAVVAAVLERLRLVCGSMDLRLTPDGEFVFLEVNSGGSFLELQKALQVPIADRLAEPARSEVHVQRRTAAHEPHDRDILETSGQADSQGI